MDKMGKLSRCHPYEEKESIEDFLKRYAIRNMSKKDKKGKKYINTYKEYVFIRYCIMDYENIENYSKDIEDILQFKNSLPDADISEIQVSSIDEYYDFILDNEIQRIEQDKLKYMREIPDDDEFTFIGVPDELREVKYYPNLANYVSDDFAQKIEQVEQAAKRTAEEAAELAEQDEESLAVAFILAYHLALTI
jgi:hypothetical protein